MPSFPHFLSLCCSNLSTTREFYGSILGLEEKQVRATSVHFDFFGHHLALHLAPEYRAKITALETEGEVPIPHFGVAVDEATFHLLAEKLRRASMPFLVEPQVAYVGGPHEQWVLFTVDPSGNALEIKSYLKR